VRGPYVMSARVAVSTEIDARERTALAFQIGVAWGDAVLDVVHVVPLRSVRARDVPYAAASLAPEARAIVEVADDGTRASMMDGTRLPLVLGARARVDAGHLTLDVRVVEIEKLALPEAADIEARALGPMTASLVVHFLALAAFALFAARLGPTSDTERERDDLLLMQAYLDAAATREMAKPPPPQVLGDDPRSEHGDLPMPGGSGSPARGEEGTMGNANTRQGNARFAVAGPRDAPDPHLARSAALREATTFGAVGLLATLTGADARTTTASWGDADALGRDPANARGAMWGDMIGDVFGTGGLGLSGAGEGGGERGDAIGLGSFGRLGHGIGTGQGQSIGPGHMVGAPGIREGGTSVHGRLPPEAIQRIVRQNFGRFRLCYENGLRTNPSLEGRVTVRFLIDRGGAVATMTDGGSSLPDAAAVAPAARRRHGIGRLSHRVQPGRVRAPDSCPPAPAPSTLGP
jgi:hypothetical protein